MLYPIGLFSVESFFFTIEHVFQEILVNFTIFHIILNNLDDMWDAKSNKLKATAGEFRETKW